MLTLAYDRIQRNETTGECAIVSQFEVRINQLPAMPDTVEQVGESRWQRKRVSQTLTILETWRVLDERKVA